MTRLLILFFILILSSCQQNPHADGERLYRQHCANCHGNQGEGLGALIPPLAQADYLKQHWETTPCLIKNGLNDTIVVNGKMYDQPMPVNAKLSDIEIANILNFIGNSWGNQLPIQQLNNVRTQLGKCR
jgi:mono/diheme cytochrome c family protein